jgi:hypothetical protein
MSSFMNQFSLITTTTTTTTKILPSCTMINCYPKRTGDFSFAGKAAEG